MKVKSSLYPDINAALQETDELLKRACNPQQVKSLNLRKEYLLKLKGMKKTG